MKAKSILTISMGAFLLSCNGDTINEVPLIEYPIDVAITRVDDCTNLPYPADTYIYPVQPGTEEWNALGSTSERMKACVVPSNLLRTMSTQGLIQTFLDNPWNNLYGENNGSEYMGFLSAISTIPCNTIYQELLKRDNAARALLYTYQKLNPTDCYMGWLCGAPLEFSLSQAEFYGQLSSSEKKVLVMEVLKKENQLKEQDEEEGLKGKFSSAIYAHAFLIAQILKGENYSPFMNAVKENQELSDFAENGLSYFEDYEIVLSLGNKYVK